MLMAVVAAAAPTASALKWEPGHLLTNYVDSSGSDFIRVSRPRLDSAMMVPLSSCMWSISAALVSARSVMYAHLMSHRC